MSEDAIKELLSAESYTLTKNRLLPYNTTPIVDTINYLLTSKDGLSLLNNLYDYLHSDLLRMLYQNETVTEAVVVENTDTKRQYTLMPEKYDSVILTNIQKDLVLLRHNANK